jgi:hypothetical protein
MNSLKEECTGHAGDMIRTMAILLLAVILSALSTNGLEIF